MKKVILVISSLLIILLSANASAYKVTSNYTLQWSASSGHSFYHSLDLAPSGSALVGVLVKSGSLNPNSLIINGKERCSLLVGQSCTVQVTNPGINKIEIASWFGASGELYIEK